MLGVGLSIPVVAVRGRRGPVVEPETTALLSRMTVTPDATRQGHINTLIKSLKTAGVWSKLDCLYVMASHDAQAARLNWKQAAYNLTPINSPTFTVDRGYQGDGSSSLLDSGFDPVLAAGQVSLNSVHLGTWTYQDAINTAFGVGNLGLTIRPRTSSLNNMDARVHSSTILVNVASMSGYSHYVVNRNGSAGFDIWGGGLKRSTIADATTSMNSLAMGVCARRIGASSFQYDTSLRCAQHWGAGLTETESAALYAALQTYLTAVGAA